MNWPPEDVVRFYKSEEFSGLLDVICGHLYKSFPLHRQLVQDSVFDAATDTLLKLRSATEISMLDFENISRFQSYLSQQARWKVIDQLRRDLKHDTMLKSRRFLSGEHLNPADRAYHRELIASLPEKLRISIETYICTGSTEETSKQLGVSKRTVQRHLVLVEEILRNLYGS